MGGLEIGSAETKIAKALKDGGFIKQPQVNISLLTIRGNKISVLGQVNKPGSYPLETFNTRISQMLAEAAGSRPVARTRSSSRERGTASRFAARSTSTRSTGRI